MGLGNNMGMGKAKGKSKPEIIKRVREVRTAKRYLSFTGSALATEQRDACRLRDINITYYHNGRNPIPRAGEIVYREKRARGFWATLASIKNDDNKRNHFHFRKRLFPGSGGR